MPHRPLSRYHQLVEFCELSPDTGQEAAIARLNHLWERLEEQRGGAPSATRLVARLLGKRDASAPMQAGSGGLYLWGGVGRGKSMLMDVFFHALDRPDALRTHFHRFMRDIHEALHRYRTAGEEDPLARAARDVATRYRVLCFDELQVQDITDAMILSRLFTLLFEQGVVVVFTSNRPPEDLYLGGLQRERFLPFIALVRSRMEVHEIATQRDYRQGRLEAVRQRYLTPDDSAARDALEALFQGYTGHAPPEPLTLHVGGRTLRLERYCREAAYCEFTELCDMALGAQDYLELARSIKALFLIGIPVMSAESRNQAKRFVTLIDVLYEARVLLCATAQAEPEALYVHGDGAFEFARTASRLREMMAEDYP